MDEPNLTEDGPSQGLLSCLLVVVIAVSLVGFLTGTSTSPPPVSPVTAQPPERGEEPKVAPARSYREMRMSPPGTVGSGWPKPAATPSPALKLTQETLDEALRRRQSRRAYDGAPPTIPHHVKQSAAAECMACHGEGLRLGKLQASIIPHDNFTNCTQCHVPDMEGLGDFPGSQQPPGSKNALPPDPRAKGNTFTGTFPPRKGERAWDIAPPVIPHGTFMRQSCLSCHGPTGSDPMRSTHPERQNCTQCHAPSAALDLRPGHDLPPPNPESPPPKGP